MHLRITALISRLVGQMSLRKTFLPFLSTTQRALGDVDVHRAGDRIGDHQRRRSEIVRAHVRVDAAFEVAVAGQHRGGDQIVLVDRFGNFLRQRPGVADAGRAAEADQVEAQRVEILLQARLFVIIRDDLRARRQRSFHPRLDLEALGNRLLGHQAGGDHHARIRRVGAGGDRSDHHVAVAEIVVAAGNRHALGHLGRLVELLVHRAGEARLHFLERNAVLRALGAGERRLDGAQFQLENVGEDRILRGLGAVHALRLGIGLDQVDPLLGAVGVVEILHRIVVDREEAAGRAVFRRHVAERGAIRDGQAAKAGAEELDELADHAALAQHLRDGEHQVGRSDAFLELAGKLDADHLGQNHRIGLAEHRGFRLDAADAPAEHRQAVDHRGVRVGADHRVGIRDVGFDLFAVELDLAGRVPDGLRQIFKIDLMADAGAGRHDAKILERALRPLQEFVALLILLVLFFDVLLVRVAVAEEIHRHRVVDDEIDRHQRIDLLRLAAEVLHRIAHRGEIDHRRHAGEILHQHARRAKGHVAVRCLGLEPLREGEDVVLAH